MQAVFNIQQKKSVVAIDAEKSYDKIPHPFMIKTVSKVGTEKNSFNLTKGIYQKSTANIIVNDESQCFPLKIRIKNVTEGFRQYNKTRKKNTYKFKGKK